MNTVVVKHLPNHMRLVNGDKLNFVPEIGQFSESQYDHSLEMPYFLNYNNRMANIIAACDAEISVGDTVKSEYGFSAVITEIKERRPSRGDFSKNKFCTKPDFIAVSLV